MAPRLLNGVMHRNQVPAYWTRESSSAFKVNVNVKSIELLGKDDADYIPRKIDAKSKTEKFFWMHDKSLRILKNGQAIS
jgi:hypothetical protein